jgi:hypothetical protein
VTEQQREMLRRRLRPTTAPRTVEDDRACASRFDDHDADADAAADVALLLAV